MTIPFGIPPEAVASTDQSLAAASQYLDVMAGAYQGAAAASSDVQALGVLVAITKGLERPMLEALFVSAVRRLALGDQAVSG